LLCQVSATIMHVFFCFLCGNAALFIDK